MIAEALAGTRIAITGATGFVGTALVERLLRSVPDCELVLLVRDGKRATAAQRVERELLKNDAFDRLREEHGRDGFAELTARRITTIRGDVGRDGLGLSDDDRQVLGSCDTIIHSAATVSFDSPLDSAVEINLLGPTRIAGLLAELGCRPRTSSPCRPATSPATAAAAHPRSSCRRDRSTSGSTGAPRSPLLAGSAATTRLPAGSQSSSPACAAMPAASSVPPAPRRWPPRPSSSASAGCATGSSRPAGRARRASGGPMPTPSPRRSVSRR